MSNGNLETLLHSKDNSLTFREILDIAIDVIHELEYLHHRCFLQVVHCDIKPSNILMDEDMTTHVADFGITEIINRSDTSIVSGTTSTLALKGSMGYIAPEYGVGGKVSTRSDIYSYGIMLLEIITSKSPTHHMFVGGLNLHKWVNMHFHTNLDEIVGKRTMEEIGEYEVNECLISLLLVGLVCSKESASERPTAREVAGVLKTIRETLLEPH